MNPAIRTLVLQFHRWTGLTVGLVLVFMAVTGALIAYRPMLEPVVNRDLLTVPACAARVSLDALAQNARAAHPEGELDYIRVTAAEEGATRIPAVQVRVAERPAQDDVFLSPCTGRGLGQRARYGGVLAVIERLHRFRFMDGGNLITGTTALLFLFVLAGGGLEVDLDSHRVLRDGETVKLTPTEFKLLVALMEQPGKILSPDQLVQKVWGPQYASESDYVRRYIWYLRQKVEANPDEPQHIRNERNVGYYFAA